MKIYKAIIFLLILVSCGNQSETPIEAANRMKALACSGNMEGFYSNIDNFSVENNFKDTASERLKEEAGGDSNSIKEFQEIVIPSLIVLKWEVMSRELANGEEGAFCNMQIVGDGENSKAVNIVFSDGKTSLWGFEERGGKLVLVSIIDEAPFDFADLDLSKRSRTQSAVQTINETLKDELDSGGPDPQEAKPVKISKPENTSEIKTEDKQSKTAIEETSVQKEEPIQSASTNNNSSKSISRPGYDFGSARWGMTKEQVVASEKSKLTRHEDNKLKYSGRYNGTGAELDYIFSGNKLKSGRYILYGSSADEQVYIDDYNRVKSLLTNRYGKPQIDQELWANSTYKDNPDRHGFAVYIGHLSYKSTWITARSIIVLELKSNNYNIVLQAVYNRR